MTQLIDPLSQVHSALWDLARASSTLNALVKTGNMIQFDSDDNRNPQKAQAAANDFPELVLVPQAGVANLHATSCASQMTRNWSWMINTGDFRANEYLHPVEWALVCAMLGFSGVLDQLEWPIGHKFVKRCDPISVQTGQSESLRLRGLAGWSSIWAVQVEMYFPTNAMIAINQGS